MNWLAKRAAWCSVFILLFSACNKDSEIGTGINPGNEIGTSYTDTVSIVTSTVLINDSITSSNQGYLMVGAYHDDLIGDIHARSFTELRLKEANKNISFTSVDSARLYLDYSGYYYGDTSVNQTLQVYEITDAISGSTTYTTQSDVPGNGTMIGSRTFSATPGIADKLIIDIDNTWAFGVLGIADGASNEAFINTLKGISICPQNNNEGAILRVKQSGTSRMIIYYKDGAENKELILQINDASDSYYNITADFAGTLSGILPKVDKPASETDDVTFIQAGVGLKTKFTLPYLSKFQEQTGTVAINKVKLILPFAENSTDEHSPLSSLFFIQTDATNRVKRNASDDVLTIQQPNTIQTGVQYTLFVTYNKDQKRYEADITDYFQALLTGKLENEGFYITPAFNTLLLERTVLNSQELSLDRPLKLEVYYTQLK